jgi:hypothetical protein
VIGALLAVATVVVPVSYDYDVTALEGARTLRIEATFRPAPEGCYAVDEGWDGLVDVPEVQAKDGWRALSRREGCVVLPRGGAERRVRYRYRLGEAAARNERADAWQRDGVMFARPSLWLLRPARAALGKYRLTVHTPEGVRFATGLSPAGADTYEGRVENIGRAPYSLFGAVTEWTLEAAGGRIRVALVPGALTVSRADLDEWILRAANAVAGYTGAFPIPDLLLAIVPSSRGRVGFGTTWGYGGASIVIGVGAAATRADLMEDWELTHEMVHLTLPNLPRSSHWMEEGLATYVEPLARARAGQLEEAEVWRQLVTQLPIGLPKAGDRGLALTHTWARTYWGGALFWFVVDTRLRERTEGRSGLSQLLAGFRRENADIRIEWGIDDLLAASERIAGVPVVREVYAELAEKPGRPDLDDMWSRLGVVLRDGHVTLEDEAQLAGVRRAIIRDAPAASAL